MPEIRQIPLSQMLREKQGDSMLNDFKRQVVELLKSLETGDRRPLATINPQKYIQHNLRVADGLAGFRARLEALPKGAAKVNTVRVFQDGNFVFAHTEYNIGGPRVGFDIFRFEEGKIVEHWDNLEQTAAAAESERSHDDGWPDRRVRTRQD